MIETRQTTVRGMNVIGGGLPNMVVVPETPLLPHVSPIEAAQDKRAQQIALIRAQGRGQRLQRRGKEPNYGGRVPPREPPDAPPSPMDPEEDPDRRVLSGLIDDFTMKRAIDKFGDEAMDTVKLMIDDIAGDPRYSFPGQLPGETRHGARQRIEAASRLISASKAIAKTRGLDGQYDVHSFMGNVESRSGYHRAKDARSIGGALFDVGTEVGRYKALMEYGSALKALRPDRAADIDRGVRAMGLVFSRFMSVQIGDIEMHRLLDNQSDISDAQMVRLLFDSYSILIESEAIEMEAYTLLVGQKKSDLMNHPELTAQLEEIKRRHTEFLATYSGQDSEIATNHPLVAMFFTHRVARMLTALSLADQEHVQQMREMKGPNQGKVAIALSNAHGPIMRIANLKARIYDSIFQQDNTELDPEVKAMLTTYLAQGGLDADRALGMMGIHTREDAQTAYRKLVARDDQGRDSEFYILLTNAIRDYHEFLGGSDRQDVDDVLKTVPHVGEHDFTAHYEMIKGVALEISSHSKDREFLYMAKDFAGMDMGGLAIPDRMLLEIHKDKANLVNVTLNYSDSDLEGGLTVVVSIDAKKQSIDWSILESMNDDEKEIVMSIAYQVLRNSRNQIAHRIAESRRGTLPQGGQPTTKKMRGSEAAHIPDEINEVRRETIAAIRDAARSQPITDEQIEMRNTIAKRGSEIRIGINIQSEQLDRLLHSAGLSDELAHQVRDAITDINASTLEQVKGRYGFKKLSSKRMGDVFRVRVNGARILLTSNNESSDQGFWSFDVLVLGSKAENYRGLGLGQ